MPMSLWHSDLGSYFDSRTCELQTLCLEMLLYRSILKHIIWKLIARDPSPFQGTSDTHKMPLWEERESNLLAETLAWPYHCQLWNKRENDLKAFLGRKDTATATGKESPKKEKSCISEFWLCGLHSKMPMDKIKHI